MFRVGGRFSRDPTSAAPSSFRRLQISNHSPPPLHPPEIPRNTHENKLFPLRSLARHLGKLKNSRECVCVCVCVAVVFMQDGVKIIREKKSPLILDYFPPSFDCLERSMISFEGANETNFDETMTFHSTPSSCLLTSLV